MKSKRFLVSFTCLIAGVAIAAFLSGASCAQRAKDAATAAPDFRRTLAKGVSDVAIFTY